MKGMQNAIATKHYYTVFSPSDQSFDIKHDSDSLPSIFYITSAIKKNHRKTHLGRSLKCENHSRIQYAKV